MSQDDDAMFGEALRQYVEEKRASESCRLKLREIAESLGALARIFFLGTETYGEAPDPNTLPETNLIDPEKIAEVVRGYKLHRKTMADRRRRLADLGLNDFDSRTPGWEILGPASGQKNSCYGQSGQ